MSEEHKRSVPEETAFGGSGDAGLESRIRRTRAVPPAGLRSRVLEEVGRCLAGGPPPAGRELTGSRPSWDQVGGLLAAVGMVAIAISLALATPLPRMLTTPRSAGDAFVRRVLAAGIPWENSYVGEAGAPASERLGLGTASPARRQPPSAGLHLSSSDAFTGDL